MLMFTYVVVTVVVAVVADEVLVNTEEMAALACELRAKIYSKIRSWAREDQPTFDEERLVSPAMHTYTSYMYILYILYKYHVKYRFLPLLSESHCTDCIALVPAHAVRGGRPGRQRRH